MSREKSQGWIGPRNRNLCLRCKKHFTWVIDFSHHLSECTKPYDIDYILDYLRVERVEGCWLMHDPRGAANIPSFGVAPKKSLGAHEIIALSAHGNRPDGLMLCHWCDNRKCLRPTHLYWGTAQQNAQDAWRNGRRTMSNDQIRAMQAGLMSSERNTVHALNLVKKNAETYRGDNHWTRRSPADKERWVQAMTEGRRRARASREGVDV